MKILIKILFIGYEFDVYPEDKMYDGETYFVDVTQEDRFAQYVVKAYELNLLDPLIFTDSADGLHIVPHKTMSQREIIEVLERIDV